MELTNKGNAVAVALDLWVQTGHESQTERGNKEDVTWVTRKFNGVDLEWPTEGAIAMRSLTNSSNSFQLKPGEKKCIVCYVLTNHDTVDYLQETIGRIKACDEKRINCLYLEHEVWWDRYWTKSAIEIGDEVLEKFWYGSHYLMASCSRNKFFPPGLFGSWITVDNPEWAGDFHLNYNYEAPWWGVYSSNHV